MVFLDDSIVGVYSTNGHVHQSGTTVYATPPGLQEALYPFPLRGSQTMKLFICHTKKWVGYLLL